MIIQLKRYGNKLVLHYIRTADIQIRKMLADPHHNFKEFIVHFILIFRKEICQKKRNRREGTEQREKKGGTEQKEQVRRNRTEGT